MSVITLYQFTVRQFSSAQQDEICQWLEERLGVQSVLPPEEDRGIGTIITGTCWEDELPDMPALVKEFAAAFPGSGIYWAKFDQVAYGGWRYTADDGPS